MPRIAIAMFAEEGHLFPSFKLARLLCSRGHEVVYVGLADFAPLVQAQGFAFVPILTDEFPIGTRPAQVERLKTARGIAYLREYGQIRFFNAVGRLGCDDDGEIAALLEQHQPDLFIIDAFMSPLALRVHAAGVPVVMLSININMPPAENYPSTMSAFVPQATARSRRTIAASWRSGSLLVNTASRLLGFNYVGDLKRAVAKWQLDPAIIIQNTLLPKLKACETMPELILCPREFDFPRPVGGDPGVHYVEPLVDTERVSGEFPWQALDPSKKLVFCTLGSQSHMYPKALPFFQAVIDAMRAAPDCQLVLAIGRSLDPAGFTEVPTNAVIVQWVPHTEMLRRAALMIQHGGLGTVKECIFFDVPMLVYPVSRDQPGYAARVVYHGLGILGDIKRFDSNSIGAHIRTLLADPRYKTNVTAMGTHFRAAEQELRGLAIIEALRPVQG